MAGLLPARPCCQLSELLGIYFGSRARLIKRQGDGQAAYFSLLRNAVARKVVRLGRAIAHMDAKYQAVKTRKRMSFFIELALPAGVAPAFTQSAMHAVPDAACDRKAMLRGLFLGCGSVNAPSSRYHLEFVVPTTNWAAAVVSMAGSVDAKVGVMERGGQHVVYVKEGDAIVRLLSLMGASRAVMEFENVRVVRAVSGEVNRRLNFETANIGKTIDSGLRQGAAVESARQGHLLRDLREAHRLRVDHHEELLALLLREDDVLAQERLRRAHHRSQRCAQLVRNGRDEVALGILQPTLDREITEGVDDAGKAPNGHERQP